MRISQLATAVSAFALLAIANTSAFAVGGNYLRKGSQVIKVSTKGGRLYCKRKSDGFEMCHGMTKKGSKWSGGNMKHPDMPGMMTFNGTVTFSGSGLNIKGCAIGQSMCDSENWKKK